MQRGTYRIIPVKAKMHTVFALVSTEDYEWLSRFKWYLHRQGYAMRMEGPLKGAWVVYMHRRILGLEKGDGLEADHINHDRLDNRRSNLRAVTRGRNAANALGRKGTSRFRGVSWHRAGGKWQAKAKFEGHLSFLGLYVREEDAARAVNRFWLERDCEAPNDVAA